MATAPTPQPAESVVTEQAGAAEGAEIVWSTQEHGLATLQNVAIFRDEVTPSPAAVYALRDSMLELATRFPDDGVYLFYVSPDVDGDYPDEPTRAAFLDLLRSTRSVLRGVVYAVLRSGLMGVTVRSLARAILHAARFGEQGAVVATLDDAGDWCEARSRAKAADLIAVWHRLGVHAMQPSGARPAEPAQVTSSKPPPR